ncbi:YvcK family protein [Candidatus Collierbacteria bacterium]|nr:YvcK family protein [Candidatus Collierbacteria bacterium]
MKKVVVIGGGTGTSMVLSSLKALKEIDLSAIVSVADSGGSTGRLRDEFGFQPVGDLRQALAALASQEIKNQKSKIKNRQGENSWIQDLLLYRFSKGNGLEGHNLGNLILTALQDMTGSTAKAIEMASKIFRLHGHIYPITTKPVNLVIEYSDGTVEIGEHILDDTNKHAGDRIIGIKTSPRAEIYSQAKLAITNAGVIIIGPGDLYGSIMPNLVIGGAPEIIRSSKAKLVFIMNLMTRYTQTHNMSANDHLGIIEKQISRKVDTVIMNNGKIPPKILKAYKEQHEYPVIDNLKKVIGKRIIRVNLIRSTLVKQNLADAVHRSYLRHDPEKLKQILNKII